MHTFPHPHLYTNPHVDADADSNPHTYTDTHADADPYAHPPESAGRTQGRGGAALPPAELFAGAHTHATAHVHGQPAE